jgi:SOS-response transcriptional repressor LexA
MTTDEKAKQEAAMRARHPLTDRQRDVIDFYRSFHERTGFWPSFRDVMAGMKFRSPEAVAGHVRRLLAKGYMARGPKGKSRTIMALPDPDENCCPTCGRALLIPAPNPARVV